MRITNPSEKQIKFKNSIESALRDFEFSKFRITLYSDGLNTIAKVKINEPVNIRLLQFALSDYEIQRKDCNGLELNGANYYIKVVGGDYAIKCNP